MSDRPDPAAIARGLSKAQRRVMMDFQDGLIVWAPDHSWKLIASKLWKLDLLVEASERPKAYVLTGIGMQVRAALESGHDPA